MPFCYTTKSVKEMKDGYRMVEKSISVHPQVKDTGFVHISYAANDCFTCFVIETNI